MKPSESIYPRLSRAALPGGVRLRARGCVGGKTKGSPTPLLFAIVRAPPFASPAGRPLARYAANSALLTCGIARYLFRIYFTGKTSTRRPELANRFGAFLESAGQKPKEAHPCATVVGLDFTTYREFLVDRDRILPPDRTLASVSFIHANKMGV